MKNITEISERDFRKLDLYGYRYEKLEISKEAWKAHFKKYSLNDILDDEKIYLNENSSWERTIAFFITELPTEDDVINSYNMLKGIKNEKERKDAAFSQALMHCACYDKYFWRDISTFNTWVGVKHIYSKRTKWLINADSEKGELHKKGIKHIYLVHIGE